MRRLFVAAVMCAAVLLVTAPVALALTAPLHRRLRPTRPSTTWPHVAQRRPRAGSRSYHWRAASSAEAGTISLNVYSFYGQPEVGAEADWWVSTDTDYGTGYGFTDASGHVDLTGVPAATSANGEIAVFLDPAAHPDNGAYDLWNLSWGDTGLTGGLQPGRLPMTIVRSGQDGWNTWSAARAGSGRRTAGGELHLARTDIARTGSTTSRSARTITTGPETLDGRVAVLLGQPGPRALCERHRWSLRARR